MSYSKSYRNVQPYSIWHEDMYNLKTYVEKGCKDIAAKYDAEIELYKQNLEKEYARGVEYGLAFEQHHDPKLEIFESKNRDLISLEGRVKSTLEKTLNDIAKNINPSAYDPKRKGTSINLCIFLIKSAKSIDMSDYDEQRGIIDEMIKNRNKSEHKIDDFSRKIDAEYIKKITNAVYEYVNALICRLYEKRDETPQPVI